MALFGLNVKLLLLLWYWNSWESAEWKHLCEDKMGPIEMDWVCYENGGYKNFRNNFSIVNYVQAKGTEADPSLDTNTSWNAPRTTVVLTSLTGKWWQETVQNEGPPRPAASSQLCDCTYCWSREKTGRHPFFNSPYYQTPRSSFNCPYCR